MLVLQHAQSGAAAGQGSHASVFAELQRGCGSSEVPSGLHRQRLLELARRLRRVQALGDEYARVGLSPEMREQLRRAQ